MRDCLFDGGFHSSKVEFYCARRARNCRKMHFSHDIVVVYWRHKFLLHNCRCKRGMASGGGWEQQQLKGLQVNIYYFSQVAANEACNFSFLPLQLLMLHSFRGCTTFMFTLQIINLRARKELKKKAKMHHNLGAKREMLL